MAGDLACVSGLLLDDITLGIQLFDVSDPTAHIELGSLELGLYYTSGLAMTETHVFVGATDSLAIVDISDPLAPQLIHMVPTSDRAVSIAIDGNFVFACDGDLQIIDVHDPASATIVATWTTDGPANFVHINGNYAYVTDVSGLTILDISTPTSPQFVGSVLTPGPALSVAVDNQVAYVADTNVQAIDISDPSNPEIRGHLEFYVPGSYSAEEVAIWQGRVLVRRNQMYVLPPHCDQVSATFVPSSSEVKLLAVPNPFNPRTSIGFYLQGAAVTTLEIFDSRGRKVLTLLQSETLPAGAQTIMWDGNDESGRAVASGVYHHRLLVDWRTHTGRMTLLR